VAVAVDQGRNSSAAGIIGARRAAEPGDGWRRGCDAIAAGSIGG
jgi:hypothetical protein